MADHNTSSPATDSATHTSNRDPSEELNPATQQSISSLRRLSQRGDQKNLTSGRIFPFISRDFDGLHTLWKLPSQLIRTLLTIGPRDSTTDYSLVMAEQCQQNVVEQPQSVDALPSIGASVTKPIESAARAALETLQATPEDSSTTTQSVTQNKQNNENDGTISTGGREISKPPVVSHNA